MLAAVLLLALVADDGLVPVDRKAMEVLRETKEAGPLVLHFDGKEVTAAEAAAAGRLHAGFHGELEKALAMEGPRPVHLFLYADAARMRAITGAAGAAAAFSTGDRSIHMPFDYDDGHELVHLFALRFPTDAESVPPEGFLVEGLATAFQREDQGIPITSWAAVGDRLGRIPSLVALRREWPKGAPGMHPYHVAGSFMEFLAGRFGIAKVKAYYTHCLEAQGTLGEPFARLEREWREWLGTREVKPEHEKAVLRAMGFPEDSLLPPGLAGTGGASLIPGDVLGRWKPGKEGRWSVKDGILTGTHDGRWSRILLEDLDWEGARALQIRFRLTEGDAFQVRFPDGRAGANEAIFTIQACFLARGGAQGTGEILAKAEWKAVHGVWATVVFVVEGGTASVYVNGILHLRTKERALPVKGPISLAVEKGTVEISGIEVFPAK
jgi:3-keto-disaccharide hydrolase